MIQVFFGNLTVKQLEERTGWEFSKEDYEWLDSHRQDNATVRSDGNSFHIFDLPFLIDVAPSIKDELLTILTKENNRIESKEAVQITVATETEEEKRERERRRKEEEEKRDPNIRWLKKWNLNVPVSEGLSYTCFINTEHIGHDTIPDEITGSFWARMDEEGLHGTFQLDDPSVNKTNHPEWNCIVGIGYYRDGTCDFNATEPFDFEGRIEDCLESSYAVKW